MKLYQIALNREIADRVNAGWRVPQYEAHLKASVKGEFPGMGFYSHVADLAVTDLDAAFEVGNIGPEGKITRHAPMRSVSVGDVLVTDANEAFIVQAFGFKPLGRDWIVTGG